MNFHGCTDNIPRDLIDMSLHVNLLRLSKALRVFAVNKWLQNESLEGVQNGFLSQLYYWLSRASEKIFPRPSIPAGSNARFNAAISRRCSSA